MPRSRFLCNWKILSIVGLLGIHVVSSPNVSWAKPVVKRIRHWSSPSSTRVVLDLSEEVVFETSAASQPPRVVIDMHETSALKTPEIMTISSTLVHRIRLARHSPQVLRLVLDLKESEIEYDAFLLPPTHGRLFRLVIDVKSPEKAKRMREERRAVQREKSGRIRVVVIDPGHGGEDPGGLGSGGTKEKDVVLDIAQMLHERLSRLSDIRAYLTRRGDYYLSLRKRVEIAQEYGASLFLSIHADASPSRKLRGASVYCLSYKGATDEAARILAERENAADLIGGVRLNEDETLNAILLDLTQAQTINESLNLGRTVLGELEHVHRLKFNTPKQAGFGVLKAPDIPSVLIEVGYISNPREEKLLRASAFHRRMAGTLENSIRRFLCGQKSVAPNQLAPGFCEKTNYRVHVVEPGQNLSRIASLYRTSVWEIQRINRIKDASRIYPGQELLVP